MRISKVFAIMSTLLVSVLYAQGEPSGHIRKKYLNTNSMISVIDNNAMAKNDTTYYSAHNIVDLKYEADTNTISPYYPTWTYQVIYKLMKTTDTTKYIIDTLKIMSTPHPADCKYQDSKEYSTEWTACKLRVISICATSGTSTNCLSSPASYPYIPQDIELELSVKSTLLGKMGNINALITEVRSGTAGELELVQAPGSFECWLEQRFITWTNVFDNFATEYELEWVYIPNNLYVAEEEDYFNNYANTLTEYREAFDLAESVRISTKEHYYPFPEEYPDDGKLYFRVRPVGRLINTALEDYDQPAFYPWWATIALDVGEIDFSDTKNWQRVTTFAEDGKFKKVISYYDGIYRSRQSLTHISSDNTVIIAETLYDHEGRGVVQMLPYPEECTDLSYKSGRRQDMDGNDWNKYDFELAAQTDGDEVKSTIGSSRYYSSANPFLNNTLIYEPNLYTPDAELHPYTQVEYLMDGTGRIFRTSGVGPDHQLGSGHETKYYYTAPLQQELVRLFGSNVGHENHYKKNYVMDANGQLSTSYLDQEGRVIATALVGDSPNNLMELEGAAVETLMVDLSDKNQIFGNNSILAYQQFNAIAGSEYIFEYRVPYSYFSIPETGPCLACTYKLEILIQGPGLNHTFTTTIVPPGSLPDPCEGDGTYYDWDNSDTPIEFPEIGDYYIYKKLTWDGDAALANIKENIIANSADVLADLQEEYLSLIDSNDCDPYLQNEGHTYGGDVYETLADMECQGMFHEMINQVSPGGYYFLDTDLGTAGWQMNIMDFDGYGEEETFNMADLIIAHYEETLIDPHDATVEYEFILKLIGGVDLFEGGFGGLTNNDVMDLISSNWRYEWGALIARFIHPEICHFDQCMFYSKHDPLTVDQTTSSAIYDLKMTQEQKISDQYSGISGDQYMNPQSNSLPNDIKPYFEDPFSTNTCSTHATNNVVDPWPAILPGSTEVADLKTNHLAPFRTVYGEIYSIWEFSHPSTYGGTSPVITIDPGINTQEGNPVLFSDVFVLNTDGDATLWNIFRGSYLQAKTDFRNNPGRLEDAGCPRLNIPDRIINLDEILDGETMPTDGAGIEDMSENILDNLDMTTNSLGSLLAPGTQGDLCYESCENKANLILDNILGDCISLFEINQWLNFQELDNSPATDDADAVVDALDGFRLEMINYCMAHCMPPLAYVIITDADLDGMEGGTHPLNGAYGFLQDLEGALDAVELIDETLCTDITNLALIDSAGDHNSTMQMEIVENCDWVDCFENAPIVANNIEDFVNDILAASSPFSVEVNNNANCTYCGCVPQPTTTNTTDQGVNYTNYFPSGSTIPLTKDCPFTDPCSTLFTTGTSLPTAISFTGGGSPRERYYLYPSNDQNSTTDCYIKFYTVTTTSIGVPTGIHMPLPASIINSIGSISNVVQTGPRSYQGYCVPNITAPHNSLSDYQSNYPTTLISDSIIAFEINLNGCQPEQICENDTIYTINHEYTVDYEVWQEDCIKQLREAAFANAQTSYNYWVEQQALLALTQFQASCIQPEFETFTMEYKLKEHHYTLYYYDQADNLVQTVPPEGVDIVEAFHFVYNSSTNHVVWDETEPLHTLKTIYQYNSLNQPIEQFTPDGGLSLFYYDDKGRITHSQNAQQRWDAVATGSGTTTVVAPYSRTLYDGLGRIIQVSERTITFTGTTNSAFNDYPLAEGSPYIAASGANTELENEPACSCYVDAQITKTYYETGTYIASLDFATENARSRVSYTTFQEHAGTAYDVGTHYSYDIHGNVKTMVSELNHLIHFGNSRYKRTDYKYDLISGKVNQVHYQPGYGDKFIHKYTYDGDNRLTMVETSPDYLFFEMDAKYYYYLHGPLARMETGERKIQGSDYAYTLHGWLKGVNTNFLDPETDMGKDGFVPGSGDNPHRYIARDGYGYMLDYYNGDYLANGTGQTHYAAFLPDIAGMDIEDALYNSTAGLYNGNISRMYTALSSMDFSLTDPEDRATEPNFLWETNGSAFHYDQLNRIKKSFVFLDPNGGQFSDPVSDKYGTEYSYDANGNLQSLQRKGHEVHSSSYLMDDFTYYYNSNTNQLNYVNDAVSGNSGPNDPDFEYDYDNDLKSQSTGNYTYDKIGNLITDAGNGVESIEWSVYGKVRKVIRDANLSDLEFVYDAAGQRVMKIEKLKASNTLLPTEDWIYTVYSRDAQGNIMTIYNVKKNEDTDKMDLMQDEVPLYGSSRLGVWNAGRHMLSSDCVPVLQYSIVNTEPFSTCDPEFEDIPLDPEILAAEPTEAFVWSNLFNSTFNIVEYQVGTSSHNIGINTNITDLVVGGVNMHRIKGVPVVGKKQYEFTDHLGNVLLTVNDVKKGFDTGSDGFADYYEPIIQTTSDYYPFGMPMPGRYSTAQQCTTTVVPETTTVNLYYHDFESSAITYYGPHSHQRMTYDGWYNTGTGYSNNEERTSGDKWMKVESTDDGDGMRKVSGTLSLNTSYTLQFDLNLGTATSVKIDIYNANASGVPQGSPTTYTVTSSGDAQTITHSTGATWNKLLIVFRQSDNATTRYFYVDDIILKLTNSPFTQSFNNNFNSPTITATALSMAKYQFDTWTPWSHSELYQEDQSGGNTRVKTVTTVSNHGAQRYYDGFTPGQRYTIGLDLDLDGSASQVKVYIWDVNGGGSISNERVIITSSGTGADHYEGNFVPLYNKILVQVRRSQYSTPVRFYMDNFAIFDTVVNQVYQVECDIDKQGYRFGFNGKEKTNEWNGEGNMYDYGFRIYDSRLCKFLSVDPLAPDYPYYTPYQFAGNKPIMAIDLDGLEEWVVIFGPNGKNNFVFRPELTPLGDHQIYQQVWNSTSGKYVNSIYTFKPSGTVNAAFLPTNQLVNQDAKDHEIGMSAYAWEKSYFENMAEKSKDFAVIKVGDIPEMAFKAVTYALEHNVAFKDVIASFHGTNNRDNEQHSLLFGSTRLYQYLDGTTNFKDYERYFLLIRKVMYGDGASNILLGHCNADQCENVLVQMAKAINSVIYGHKAYSYSDNLQNGRFYGGYFAPGEFDNPQQGQYKKVLPNGKVYDVGGVKFTTAKDAAGYIKEVGTGN